MEQSGQPDRLGVAGEGSADNRQQCKWNLGAKRLLDITCTSDTHPEQGWGL